MTDAELTVLSLVSEGERFGYEIQQLIDARGLREWLTIGFSSIYYILNRLERQNLLTSELRSGRGTPAQKVYRITDAGKGVLQTSVSDLLRQPRALGTGFELGLANLTVLKPRQVYKVLSHHRTDLQQRLELVRKSWERHQQDDDEGQSVHIRALFTHSIALMEAELSWLDSFIEDWRARHPSVTEASTTETNEVVQPHEKKTELHRRTTPDPVKMIQKLKRPKQPPAGE